MTRPSILALSLSALLVASASAAPQVAIRLPERFRVLTDQRFDLRVEATGISDVNAAVAVFIDNQDVTALLGTPEVTTNNDGNNASLDKAWTFRTLSLANAGVTTLSVVVTDATGSGNDQRRIGVQAFQLNGNKNIILYIGDAMGTAFRDLGRIVAMSTNNRFREGFFDELQAMDKMPVAGMAMTYSSDRIVPDSAPTATAWSTGNKTIEGALGVFPDNTDFKASTSQNSKRFALDNPKIEAQRPNIGP